MPCCAALPKSWCRAGTSCRRRACRTGCASPCARPMAATRSRRWRRSSPATAAAQTMAPMESAGRFRRLPAFACRHPADVRAVARQIGHGGDAQGAADPAVGAEARLSLGPRSPVRGRPPAPWKAAASMNGKDDCRESELGRASGPSGRLEGTGRAATPRQPRSSASRSGHSRPHAGASEDRHGCHGGRMANIAQVRDPVGKIACRRVCKGDRSLAGPGRNGCAPVRSVPAEAAGWRGAARLPLPLRKT